LQEREKKRAERDRERLPREQRLVLIASEMAQVGQQG